VLLGPFFSRAAPAGASAYRWSVKTAIGRRFPDPRGGPPQERDRQS